MYVFKVFNFFGCWDLEFFRVMEIKDCMPRRERHQSHSVNLESTSRETSFSPWHLYFFSRRPCRKSDLRQSALRKLLEVTISY